MTRFLSELLAALLLSLVCMLFLPGSVSAHERRNVGKYEFVVGFIVEPAFESQKSGVDLRVTNTETKKPLDGVEKTLQVEITHIPSGVSSAFKLRTIFRDPGHYTNDIILTAPGQYSLRFFGNIEGTPVNEIFLSGPGRFSDVESSAELQFPLKLPEIREVAGAVRGAQSAAQEAQGLAARADEKASTARTLAFTGIIAGALGIAMGAGSIVMVMRRK